MAVTDSAATLGFLAAVDREPLGVTGGYLILNASGRPLEFHCTTPIKPSRAQQILYGATLEPFLYGEQIGQALVRKSKHQPLAVLVDRRALLSVRDQIELPTALVIEAELAAGSDGAASPNMWPSWSLGANQLAVPSRWAGDQEKIAERLASLDELMDLAEPFVRIREAIDEAYRSSVKSAA